MIDFLHTCTWTNNFKIRVCYCILGWRNVLMTLSRFLECEYIVSHMCAVLFANSNLIWLGDYYINKAGVNVQTEVLPPKKCEYMQYSRFITYVSARVMYYSRFGAFDFILGNCVRDLVTCKRVKNVFSVFTFLIANTVKMSMIWLMIFTYSE